MSGEKYIGLDVRQATISVAVMDSQGKRKGLRHWLRSSRQLLRGS